jgi:nucleotide-binding universal stress UspA family protein
MPAARLFRRILVGWDASRDAAAALRAAAAIAGDEQAHVVALAVLAPGGHAETAAERSADKAAVQDRVRRPFEELCLELAGSGCARMTLQFREDRNIVGALCGYAAEYGFDLLVLGRRGDASIAAGKLGRVADAAARNSTIPVLLISAP